MVVMRGMPVIVVVAVVVAVAVTVTVTVMAIMVVFVSHGHHVIPAAGTDQTSSRPVPTTRSGGNSGSAPCPMKQQARCSDAVVCRLGSQTRMGVV